jgi:hypothetical protein
VGARHEEVGRWEDELGGEQHRECGGEEVDGFGIWFHDRDGYVYDGDRRFLLSLLLGDSRMLLGFSWRRRGRYMSSALARWGLGLNFVLLLSSCALARPLFGKE